MEYDQKFRDDMVSFLRFASDEKVMEVLGRTLFPRLNKDGKAEFSLTLRNQDPIEALYIAKQWERYQDGIDNKKI